VKFVYRPEGVEKRWDFDVNALMTDEAELIERHTKMTYGEWSNALNRGSMLAYRALLFVYLRRDNRALKWADVQFRAGDVDIEYDDDEVTAAIAELERLEDAEGGLTEPQADLLAMLRRSLEDEGGAEPAADDDADDTDDADPKETATATA